MALGWGQAIVPPDSRAPGDPEERGTRRWLVAVVPPLIGCGGSHR